MPVSEECKHGTVGMCRKCWDEVIGSLRTQLRESEEREKMLMTGIRGILGTPISKIVREHLQAISDGGKHGK